MAGTITEIYKFKFIYNENISHKCMVTFKIKVSNKEEFELIAFDEMVEKVIKNKFKFVYLCAKFVEKCRIKVIEIYGEE